MTMPRSFVMLRSALGAASDPQGSFKRVFREKKVEKRKKKGKKNKKGDLLQCGFGLGPTVEVVDVVVAQLGAVGQDLDALHADGFVGQALLPPPQFCGEWGENGTV